ncbi:NF-kappa-B inhibitor zeta isoform X2 [Austrofundulus limnaeus]|uniref:NF-kappa-B inhibitor zeta isoform X2 n=1 Tax=Austrofundulus limnaeus TaxID=52670 RepID=A0A2I4C7C4_AUSLI|nr:PREDICTED: NF-kappa-B inhibitor zeta-like isoform X2 [Austrofundulus limnaeus]
MRGQRRKKSSGAGLCSSKADLFVPGDTSSTKTGRNKGSTCSLYEGDKVYLGVRVRMPVKDMLKNIRLSQGHDSTQQKGPKTASAGNLKRARTRPKSQAIRVQHQVKGLEELAIIIEVLEEDLKTSSTCQSPTHSPPSSNSPGASELSPADSSCDDDYDEIIPSPDSYTAYSPSSEYQSLGSPPDCMFSGLQPTSMGSLQRPADREEWFQQQVHWDQNSSAFFWMQLQREESQLRATSDADLLGADEHGRIALHKVVCLGKRPLSYAIAKRMAALNSLDLKDSDGMTALLYAAKHNQHLLVADLISLGANVNERNNQGKSCLHLSAENGYIRVLEVLRQAMVDGVNIDVDAVDVFGMSALQCAAVALKTNMSEVKGSLSPDHSRLQTLRQEYMRETLECLLQISSYQHSTACPAAAGELTNEVQSWLSSQHVCLAGHFATPTVMF